MRVEYEDIPVEWVQKRLTISFLKKSEIDLFIRLIEAGISSIPSWPAEQLGVKIINEIKKR